MKYNPWKSSWIRLECCKCKWKNDFKCISVYRCQHHWILYRTWLQTERLAGQSLSTIWPLHLIRNAAARFIFPLPNFSHTTTLLCFLHWLSLTVLVRFKRLMLAYKAQNGQSTYCMTTCTASYILHSMLKDLVRV